MRPFAPNIVAYIALISWPFVSLLFYRTMPFLRATLLTVLAAQLLLPSAFFLKVQMIPEFDKDTVPTICVFFAVLLMKPQGARLKRTFGFLEILMVSSIIAPVMTSMLNGDTIVSGGKLLPGVGIYDGMSAGLFQAIVLMPFVIGRLVVRGGDDLIEALRLLVFAGLAYSLPLLFEIRFSPQLHAWVYGYYPSDFVQTVREDGGFRPQVFFKHGLLASFFAMTTVVSAATLWRLRMHIGKIPAAIPTLYLAVVLALCKSGAALMYSVLVTPLVLLTSPRTQARVAVILALIALTYPVTRMLSIFPNDAIVSAAEVFSSARASSLKFRFDEEERLLDKAMQRPVFGWGRYGRNRIYAENWEGEEVDAVVTDGRWIITFGQFGVVGFLLEFGLLAFPVFRAAAAIKRATSHREAVAIAAVALLVAVNMIELLPNSTLSPWSWLLDGCLLGCSEAVIARVRTRRPKEAAFPANALAFAR